MPETGPFDQIKIMTVNKERRKEGRRKREKDPIRWVLQGALSFSWQPALHLRPALPSREVFMAI